MAMLYKAHASIALNETHQDVYDIGDVMIGIPNFIEALPYTYTFSTGDLEYFSTILDSKEAYAGPYSIAYFNTTIQTYIEFLKDYLPNVYFVQFPLEYSSGYEVKLTNSEGHFVYRTYGLSGSSTNNFKYETGTPILLCGNVFDASNTNFNYSALCTINHDNSQPITAEDSFCYCRIRSSNRVNADVYEPTTIALEKIVEFLNGCESWSPTPPEPEEDPYAIGGETEKAGGDGDFDTFSDEIPVPDVPTVTVDNTGFISLYTPSIAQLKSLASYLWASTGLDLDTFKRIFTDPISTILGLTIVPVTPPTGVSNNVVLGNVDTGVSMPRISNQYVQYDCGTLNVNEFWGGYLDYSPYTSLEIYLPFIGTKPLNIDDIMGHTIHVVYNIDLLSGACCAVIESARRVLYQFIGQCSCSVPVTGRDMTNLINGILSVVGAGAGTFVATGGNPGLSGASAIGALASNVAKSKPKVEKSGSMGSMGGMLGVRCPYLIITRPRQALPTAQNRYTGYPSFITCVLGTLVGYTEVYKVHLGDIPATDAEKAEIETLLMNGVIL